jgi:pre-mRNA-splicing factor 38B
MSRSALEREIVVQSKKNSSLPPNVPPPPVPPSLLFNTAPPISVIPGNHIVAAAIPTPKAVIIPAIPIPIPAPIPLMHQAVYQASLGYSMPAIENNEDDEEDSNGIRSEKLPMYGNSTTFNINNLLYNNIMENEYFRALYQLRTYHEVIDEIYRSVNHVEPWQTGTTRYPSSAFCLLVKFMLMKLTLKQMKGLLSTNDSPLVRAIGFLYLRYTSPPTDLWRWFEPYLEDDEEIQPSSDKTIKMSTGSYCTKLLTDMQYYGTTLPRIPIPIERKMKVMLLLLEEKKRRRRANARSKEQGLFCPGAKVKAIYSDDNNEPAWYEAVIDSPDKDVEDKYWVTFPEYGNTEYVDLGDMELIDASGKAKPNDRNDRERSGSRGRQRDSRDRDRDRDRPKDRDRDDSRDRDGRRRRRSDSRSRSRSRDRDGGGDTENLLEKVLKSERDASAAIGRNYGHRPASYKGDDIVNCIYNTVTVCLLFKKMDSDSLLKVK